MPLSVVILAAGQGKRMNSDLPKVLQPLAGRAAAAARHPHRARTRARPNIFVVYGHGGAQVPAAPSTHEDLDWVLQAEQLGTGHAVMQAMSLIPDDHTVLVLYGDVPLIRAHTLQPLLAAAQRRRARACSRRRCSTKPRATGASCATAMATCAGIVEHQDASAEQLRSTRSTPG